MTYKKGDVEDVINYRPICSLPVMYKLLSTILYGRLYPMLDQNQAEGGLQKNLPDNGSFCDVQNVGTEMPRVGINMRTASPTALSGRHSYLAMSIMDTFASWGKFAKIRRRQYRQTKRVKFSISKKAPNRVIRCPACCINTVLQYALKSVIQRWQKKKRMGNYLRPRTRLPDELAIRRRRDVVRNLQRTDTEHDVRIQRCNRESGTQDSPRQDENSQQSEQHELWHKKDNIKIVQMSIEILAKNESAKHLGQRISFHQQETLEIKSRIRAACTTFHKNGQELTSKKYMLKLRLRLFDATVSLRLFATLLEHGHRAENTKEWVNRRNARCCASSSRRKRKYKKKWKASFEHKDEEGIADKTGNCSTDDESGDGLST